MGEINPRPTRTPMSPRPVVIASVLLFAAPAVATAGTITGTAYLDRNSNGAYDTATFTPGAGGTVKAGDAGVVGVVVRAYDSTGTAAGTATTANDGSYTLTTSATGTVRLEFSTPSGYEPSFRGSGNGTSVQFVNATTTGADFALGQIAQYCQDSPSLVTCSPPFKDSMTTSPANPGGILVTSTLQGITAGASGDVTAASSGGITIANNSALGSVFGVGVDRQRNVYFGTYVKRHSAYGPSGATNTIYRRNLDVGTSASVTPFITLPGSLPPHSEAAPTSLQPQNPPPYGVDGNRAVASGQVGYSDVYSKVGRAGLGDVDVSPDGAILYAIDMDESAPKLWTIPIEGSGDSVTAGTPTSTALTTPSTFGGVPCIGTWHPMGIGVRGDRVLIGGVCGADQDGPRWNIASASRASNQTTVTTTTPHTLAVGDVVKVTTGTASFNNSGNAVTVNLVPSNTTFRYSNSGTAGSAAISASSNVIQASSRSDDGSQLIFTASRTSNVVTVQTLSAHGLQVGERVQVSTDSPDFNGVAEVTAVPSTNQFRFASNGADGSASISLGTSSASPATRAAAFVQELSAGTFSTVAAFRLDYLKAAGGNFQTILSPSTIDTGSWHAWTDATPPWPNPSPASDLSSYGQPMLSNVEILDDGDLALSMRDRYMDQVAVNNAVSYESSLTPGSETLVNGGFGTAEAVRLCWSGSTYSLESGGACGSTVGARQPDLFNLAPSPTPLFYWTGFADYSGYYFHNNASIGGTATMPGSSMLWTTAYDIKGIDEQGVKALGPCASAGTCGPVAPNGGQVASLKFDSVSATFKKGNGLGDLELVCDAAPVQIGNRVWIDTNANGIQDPGEAPVAGVTVRLYDANSTVVGTALTDADGLYYFSSNVNKPAGGDGTNVGGGLVTGAAFTIRLDKPEDFYTGTGPLAPYALTAPNQTSPGAGSQSGAVDSTATVVASYPQISVPSRAAGVNNHTYDIGFVTSATPGWPQQGSGGGGSGGGGSGGGSGGGDAGAGGTNGSGGATSNGGGSGSGSGSGGSSTPVIDPKAASTSAQPPASGMETGRTSRVVIRTGNKRGSTAPSMKTIIRIPAGVEVVAAPGGTILANTVSFSASDVRNGGGRSYVLFLRPMGKARTIRIPVTVTMTSPVTITRSVLSLRVRAGNPLLPAVTG